jgi:hypothetical protein
MKQLVLIALCVLFTHQASAHDGGDLKAFTVDGRTAMLREDHTWEFFEAAPGDPSSSAVLSVTKVQEMQEACKFQFRLQNNLGYKIGALVPRLAIHNQDGIIYESKSISFTTINPTKAEYTEVQFDGIGCHQMSVVKVIDASRCRMGDIDQWNEEEGQCLSRIYVEPSELINISK